MRFAYGDSVYAADRAIVIGGMNYVPGRLSAEKRQALGITVVEDPAPVDTRFYTQSGDAEPVARPVADIRAMLTTEIKAAARAIILEAYPDWKQANMTARGVELTMKVASGDALTEDEQAEADALQAAWDWIKSVRLHSDALEAELASRNFVALKAWAQHDWPALPE